MRRTPLAAMLTIAAVSMSTLGVAGCGGKGSSTSEAVPSKSTTHKHKSKPAY